MTSESTGPASNLSLAHRRPICKRAIWCGIIVVFVVAVLPFVTAHQTRSRMDAITGARESQTTWMGVFTIGPTVEESPLALRAKEIGVTWKRDWRFLSTARRTLFGTQRRGCSLAPAIHELHPMLKGFVTAATDSEIEGFIRLMQTGTDSEQRLAIDAAIEKAFQFLEASGRR